MSLCLRHLFEYYQPVVDSGFLGGRSSYSSLLEDFPYALNGLVPLAAVTGDKRLARLCDQAIVSVLATQGRDGWLGPVIGHLAVNLSDFSISGFLTYVITYE